MKQEQIVQSVPKNCIWRDKNYLGVKIVSKSQNCLLFQATGVECVSSR